MLEPSCPVAPESTLPQPAGPPPVALHWVLSVIGGVAPGPDELALEPATELRLGRDPACGPATVLFAPDGQVSRLHAVIRWDTARGRWLLRDQQSRNGTFLNGRRVVGEELLDAGDLVRIGDTVLLCQQVVARSGGWSAPANGPLLGRSRALRHVLEQVARMAPRSETVLIHGPSGAGKELVARLLHEASGRSGPLVAVNVAELVESMAESQLFGSRKGSFTGSTQDEEGLIRAAARGTLLLDEIGELSPTLQAKLLRVLQEGVVRPVGMTRPVRVDVRFIAATHRDLEAEVAAGRFRQDLLARLSRLTLEFPSLHDRPEDLQPILTRLLAQEAHPYQVSGEVWEALVRHPLPRNVRELERVASTAAVVLPMGGRLLPEHLPDNLRSDPVDPPPRRRNAAHATPAAPAVDPEPASLPPRNAVPTRQELVALLIHFRGCVAAIADHTGKERRQVYRWLEQHDLDLAEYRNGRRG